MKFKIKKSGGYLSIDWKIFKKDHYKVFSNPVYYWWKARKFFKRPKFKFYFGPMHVKGEWFEGNEELGLSPCYLPKQKGYWPYASTEFLKWYTPKWFPIYITSRNISWKDKWNAPRYEYPAYFSIFFGRSYQKCWQFLILVHPPKIQYERLCEDGSVKLESNYPDDYYQMLLWYLEYYKDYGCDKPNLKKAFESYPFGGYSSHLYYHITDYNIICQGDTVIDNEKYYYITIKDNNKNWKYDEYSPYLQHENYVSIDLMDNKHFWSRYIVINDNTIKIFFKKDAEWINYFEKQSTFTVFVKDNIKEIHFSKYQYLYNSWDFRYLTKKGLKEIYTIE